MRSVSAAAGVEVTAADRLYESAASAAFELLWWTARTFGTSPHALRCRRGALPAATGPLLWFHGASAGELRAAAALAWLLTQRGYRFTAAYTATNEPGLELATRLGGPHAVVALAPWDHPRWVARAFDQWRPQALFLIETELWPALVLAACRRHIPVFCVSARIYPRDFARYRLIRSLTAPMLRRVTAVLAQDEVERNRFIALGAAPPRCSVAGNLKYVTTNDARPRDPSWYRELGLCGDVPVVVFGSIHGDEVSGIFAALDQLPMARLRVIVAPRHPSAVAAIVRAARRRHWLVHQRTAGAAPENWQILVLDRMGELPAAYALASVAVVGGGFARHGGHNPIEPVMMGAPVVYGPHFAHFEHEVHALTELTPMARVCTAAELAQRLTQWLADSGCRRRVLELQRRAIPDGRAIAQHYVDALSLWLTGLRCEPATQERAPLR